MAGESIGNLVIKTVFDGNSASAGVDRLIGKMEELANQSKMTQKILGAFGLGMISGADEAIGKLIDLGKWAIEFGKRMEGVSATIVDHFGRVNDSFDQLAMLSFRTGQSVEDLAQKLGELGDVGLSFEAAVNLARGASLLDDKFGGVGKGMEAFNKALLELQKTAFANDKLLESFENRGVKVFEHLAEQLGVSVEKAKELSKMGEISSIDAQVALAASKMTTSTKHNEVATWGDETSGYMDFAPPDAAELEALREGLAKARLEKLAVAAANALETPAQKFDKQMKDLAAEIESASKLTDAESMKNLQTLRDLQSKMLTDKEKIETEKTIAEAASALDEANREAEEFIKAAADSFKKWESEFLSVATASEAFAYKIQQQIEAMTTAQQAGDAFGYDVAQRRMGKMALDIANRVPEVKQIDPFAGVSLAGSQEAYRDRIMSQFPPEKLSLQERLAEGIREMNETSAAELEAIQELARIMGGQNGPKLAHMV